MQIHEIFRSRTNEGILKGVRTLPPRNDRGRFMPRAATAAFNQMATQLQNQPAAPASLPTATTPAPGSTPAYGRRLSGYGQQSYNVPTGAQLPAQAAPAAKPAVPAPAASPTATQPWQPVNPNVKPGGSKEAQAFQAQQAAQKQAAQKQANAAATAPVIKTPGKAGFMRNAAEYFANKTMNAAGIPIDQQGEYHPGGHMAALQGKGLSAIRRAETDIASKLAGEWARTQTLNGKRTALTPAAIKSAANLMNQAGDRLPVDFDNINKLVVNYAQDFEQRQQQAKHRQAQAQVEIDELIAQLKSAEEQHHAELAQNIIDKLRQNGVSNKDIDKIRASVVTDVQNNLTNTVNKMVGEKPPVQPVTTDQLRGAKPGAPTQQDYANLEKKLQQAMAAQGQPA